MNMPVRLEQNRHLEIHNLEGPVKLKKKNVLKAGNISNFMTELHTVYISITQLWGNSVYNDL